MGLGLVSASMRHLEMCCVALHCVVCTQLRHASFHLQFVVGYYRTWSLYFLSHCVLGVVLLFSLVLISTAMF
jgi:membrane protein CcdC involved in cytochrome C biogenesis